MLGQIVYHDASAFPLLGKATEHTATRYERLPDSLENVIREPLWELGRCSAGLAVRFRSNTTTIAARWDVLFNRDMHHMTATGVKGLDLYCLVDGEWRFVNSGRPQGKSNEATIISHMQPLEREYMLYLSLYDGVTSLSIGVDSLSALLQPAVELPVRTKPVVCYGTSILQGGCATRPGMAHTNILSRWLNREFINLGFSGNALLDYEIAEVISGVDASLYILDFVPNAGVQEIEEKAERFFNIIRSKRPEVPVLFVEDPVFTHTLFDQRIDDEVKKKNEALHTFFNSLKARGEQNIHLLSSRDMLGHDGEATVDGIHFTDLGFVRYAELLHPLIKEIVGLP
ncbi:SGNH/GDSL hydrolase family protein [Bacteroides sp. OttesenSCG-928-J23]|nr:SGNH/GDSL hydrolase family protein [Bacteroides sp. OttesenSCG-928-J23]MDL2304336.1 SGNH/GDSL hydrolase family protein [Bacteroides sp. OttesenSCG-928-D19]